MPNDPQDDASTVSSSDPHRTSAAGPPQLADDPLACLGTAPVRAFLHPRHQAIADEIAAFVKSEIAPLPPPDDDGAARRQARQILGRIGGAGLFGFAVPKEHGGRPGAPDWIACALAREALAAVSPLADAVFALQGLGSLPISLAGSAEQKERWLPAVARGEAMAAFALTEPEAGSDAAALATAARPAEVGGGDGYRLDGVKTFISNAGIADYYCIFARTGPGEGSKGISCFVVPADTPGLRFAAPQVLSAPHPLGEIVLDDCRVPAAARLGEEGGGLKLALATLDRLRATVAAAACGMAGRALAEALAHVRRRHQFGRPLSDLQLVQGKLADMATELTAARLLTYRAAWEADGGAPRVTLESAMAKAHATEAAQRIVDGAVQLLGGRGTLAHHPVDHLYRAVRALRIYEGATEVQKVVIARQLL